MEQLIETEMNIFLGTRYKVYYPIHMPSMMITFVQLLQYIEEGAYHNTFTCLLMMGEIIPEYFM